MIRELGARQESKNKLVNTPVFRVQMSILAAVGKNYRCCFVANLHHVYAGKDPL